MARPFVATPLEQEDADIAHLAIDVGGTKVALHLMSAYCEERRATFTWAASGSVDSDVAQLTEAVRAIRDAHEEPLQAVGVAMPATVAQSGLVTAWPSRPSWVGLNLREHLRELLPGVEARWADDGDLAALAEAREAGCTDLLYVGVGTGIGGGAVLDGRMCPGPLRGSCEIGHVVVDRSGPRCACGRRGCVQAIASGPAILRRAGRSAGRTVDLPALRTALHEDEAWAVRTVQGSAHAVATAIVNACELLRPSLVLVGGGFAAALPAMVDAVATEVEALGRAGHEQPPVRRAALGGLSSLRGALLLAREGL